LRWWSRVRNDGKEEWHYESLEKSKNIIRYFLNLIFKGNENKVDNRIFWTS